MDLGPIAVGLGTLLRVAVGTPFVAAGISKLNIGHRQRRCAHGGRDPWFGVRIKRRCAMTTGLSRRGFVVGDGALLSASAVRVGVQLPETALAAQVSPPPGVLTAKDIVVRNFARSDIDQAVVTSRRRQHGRALWGSLAALGLRPDLPAAYGAYAHVRPHASDEGSSCPSHS